jgi:hypothetical protein
VTVVATQRGAAPGAGRQAYLDALQRLCALAEVPPAEHELVLSREAIQLGGVVLAFQFEPASNFVKVFVEVGRPRPADELAFYRFLLTQHLAMPSPFSMVAALHHETEQVVLYANAAVPDSPENDSLFLALLVGCVQICRALRNAGEFAPLEPAPAS